MAHFQEGVSVYIPTYWLCDCNSLSSKGNYAWWPVILVRWHFMPLKAGNILPWPLSQDQIHLSFIWILYLKNTCHWCCSLNNSGYRRVDVHLTVTAYFNFSTFSLSLPSTCLSLSSPILIWSKAYIFHWLFSTPGWSVLPGRIPGGTSRRRR